MHLLAVDTATEVCSVAICHGGRAIAEVSLNHGQTHARYLMPAVTACLDAARMSLDQMDAFVVTRGPGSFTGLRIGISTAKGLAAATGKPLVGVSSLEALARQSIGSCQPLICPMLDARRQEVYWSLYRIETGRLAVVHAETATPPAEVAARISQPCLFVGSGALLYADVLANQLADRFVLAPQLQHDVRGRTVALLGAERIGNAETEGPVTPVYLRRADAKLPAACPPLSVRPNRKL